MLDDQRNAPLSASPAAIRLPQTCSFVVASEALQLSRSQEGRRVLLNSAKSAYREAPVIWS